MPERFSATIVSHTHWDRAWYVPFQEFRVWLVRHLDCLLDLMEEDLDFRCFMLDGQTAMLEDYLQVRPEHMNRVRRLIQAGRIQVGPWYVLPDEYLEGPEAMVRNLMLGHRMAEEMGKVQKVGYTPDAFGHIAQLPQVLAGFGIDNAVLWRGMGPEGERLGNEFIWRAPDGTGVLAIWLADSYSNASFVGYPNRWGRFTSDQFDMAKALADLRGATERLKPLSHSGALLLMNGVDHMPAQAEIPSVIREATLLLTDTTLYHGTLDDHLRRVRAAPVQLPEWSGEFNRGYYHVILGGVYSARMPLKQANHQAETLLVHYAEPLSALAWLAADRTDWRSVLWQAWRYVLKNHPHDDICGCSVDETHADDFYRFRQATEIGEMVVRESLRTLAGQVDTTGQSGVPILVYNPLTCTRTETLVTSLPFNPNEGWADDFQIVDHTGAVLSYQILGDQDAFWSEPMQHHAERHITVAMPVEVPACGYRTYYLQPDRSMPQARPQTGLRIGERGAENDAVAFQIAMDGSISLQDKRTGVAYRRLNCLEDTEDAGDEYSYSPAPQSQTVTSEGIRARVTCVHAGPLQATFRVDLELTVPRGLTEDLQGRARETIALPVSSEITLFADQPRLYFRTRLDNRVCDHRLRVGFPTPHRAQSVHVDGHFALLEREIDVPGADGWVEGPIPTQHQRAFVEVHDGAAGMALLNRGLPEYEARQEKDGTVTLYLTLLRCVGVLGRGPILTRRAAGAHIPAATPGAQNLGEHTFEYALVPHQGDLQAVFAAATAYNAPLLSTRVTRQAGPHPSIHSFVASETQQFVLSSLKRGERGEGLVLRGYAAADEAFEAVLRIGFPVRAVYRTNLNEERIEKLTPDSEGAIRLPLDGHQVATVEIIPQRGG